MRKIVKEFLRRGLVACGFGPLILDIVYLILQNQTGLETITVNEVCIGIVSLSALAFIAGGMNVVYQIDHLPLMIAILIHGMTLYISYLITYIVNDWIEISLTPIFAFTAIFILGYLIIWIIIYTITKRNTEKLNQILKEKQQHNKD